MTISVTGDDTVEAVLNKIAEGLNSPNIVTYGTGYIERGSKMAAPVDTGLLRASITSSVRTTGDTIEGIVGSPVKYAETVEPITIKLSARYYLSKFANDTAIIARLIEGYVRSLLR